MVHGEYSPALDWPGDYTLQHAYVAETELDDVPAQAIGDRVAVNCLNIGYICNS